MALTTTHGLPYPEDSDDPDIPRDIKALAEAVDAKVTQGLLSAGTLVPGPYLFGAAPVASSDFTIQAGTTIIDPTDQVGYFRITWPKPFKSTLLTVIMVSGDASPGNTMLFVPHHQVWGLGDLTDTEWQAIDSKNGAALANKHIRVNWIAMGW